MGLDATAPSKTKADTGTREPRIDAHTHFAPLKFLEFAEKEEGHAFPLTAMYKGRPALTDIQARLELLDQNGQTTSADELLDLTICEPALGSGAFLNEAINQLSAEFLARKQNELEDTIDPEEYAGELQKVKTHFALHQSYGVNRLAIAGERNKQGIKRVLCT